jgi:hypothetical protein
MGVLLRSVASLLLVLASASAEALTLLAEAQKLVASDGEAGDSFGISLTVSRNTALVGRPADGDNGDLSGSAYLFVRNSDGRWHEQQKLLASDGEAGDLFGDSVAIDGDTAVIGAVLEDDNGEDSGSAYIFVRGSDGRWTEQAKLLASDGEADDLFGVSVAVSGNAALLGAPKWIDEGEGVAYIFDRDGDGRWQEQAKLLPGDRVEGDEDDFFGWEVALSGDTALVGAEWDGDNGVHSGSAYLFVRGGDGRWSEQQKLLPGDGAQGDEFGFSVAIDGDTALIGAPYDGDNGIYSGSAYVFVRGGDGRWREQQKLLPGDGAAEGQFGFIVAVSGNTALVSSTYDGDDDFNSGSVYLFVRGGEGQWYEQAKLLPSDRAEGNAFGLPVAVNGNTALVGPYGGEAAPSRGPAYVFNLSELYADLAYLPVTPCRIVDTRRTSEGIIGASSKRGFHAFGPGEIIGAQGGNPAGCSPSSGEPLAAHINMIAVDPTGKGNLQAFPVDAGAGAGLSVNYNTIDTNLANAGTVRTFPFPGPNFSVTSNFSSAHTVIDVLGYYYPDGELLYAPVTPCRIADTRKTSAGIIAASSRRGFRVFGPGSAIAAQGGNASGCSSPLGEPRAVHINMIAVDPARKGNLQAFPADAGAGAGLSVNYNTIGTNLSNAGTVKTVTGSGANIAVASNFSSAHAVIDVLGYYYPADNLSYTPVTPCRVVDTRRTREGIIGASAKRSFRVFGSGESIRAQGGNPDGCFPPSGEPLAANINMIAVDPAGKGNLQAFPADAGAGAGLSVNYNTIDTNLANDGTVKTVTGSGADITVTSNFSSAHAVIDVLGYYYEYVDNDEAEITMADSVTDMSETDESE